MNKTVYRTVVIAIVAIVVAATIVAKQRKPAASEPPESQSEGTAPAVTHQAAPSEGKALPQVLDFGRGVCTMCKMMKPVLDELAKEYDGRAIIKIIDIDEQEELTDQHKIELIPTQVFLDAEGKEVFRHTGFMPKEDIVAKLKEMGVE